MNDSTKARACLQQIVELFQTGNVPQALAVATIPPQSGIPSARWSWSNRLLQFLADTSDARGYRQWQEAGRQVKKGAKSFHILGPKTRKITRTNDEGETEEKLIVAGFYSIPVFRVFRRPTQSRVRRRGSRLPTSPGSYETVLRLSDTHGPFVRGGHEEKQPC